MKHIPRLTTALILATAGLLSVGTTYAGPLQTGTLNSPGDLTIDTNTGLEYLDPSVTSGLTYNQIASSDFVTNEGFTLATTSQVEQLFSDGGITDFSGNFSTANEAAAESLLDDFIGETITGPITLPPAGMESISDGVYGFTDDSGAPDGQFNVAGLDYQSAALDQAPQDQARAILNLITFPGDTLPPNPGGNGINGSIAGGFLVRASNVESVPEPSSIGIMSAGLLMLIGAGFRRRRCRHSSVK